MFTPLPMQRVTLYLLKDEAPRVASVLGQFGVFEPARTAHAASLLERTGQDYRETCERAATHLKKIVTHLAHKTGQPQAVTPREVARDELDQLDDWLNQLWQQCSEREEGARKLSEEQHAVDQLSEALSAYTPLDVDLGLLQSDFRFLDMRVGTVPSEQLDRLRDAVGLLGGSLTEFSRRESDTHVLLAGQKAFAGELDSVLGAASFHELRIPAEFSSHPRKVRADLKRRRDRVREAQLALRKNNEEGTRQNAVRLDAAAETLARAALFARVSVTLQERGGLACIDGWVPADRVEKLRPQLHGELGNRFVLECRDPLPAEQASVPSAMRHNDLLKPFATLVRTYGVPRYGEVDPTWLFAISFVAMFGMMFGDIGHGLVIAAGGIIARRKLHGFAPFVVAIGASSTLFGFLYGSMFGSEELIHPLWIAPLSNPALMLKLALYWGIAFIVIMTLITVRNRIHEGRTEEALMSGKGLAGVAFYLALIFVAARGFGGAGVGLPELAAMLLPLLVIVVHEWRGLRAPLAEKMIVVSIEAFETVLGFVTNTLSFLRVAAFGLNHVALAIAVFTMADMLGTTGHWLVVVLGNIFILVLEGAIVTIQVLRLEYYEGFSRFFSGDGREFQPLVPEFAAATARKGVETV